MLSGEKDGNLWRKVDTKAYYNHDESIMHSERCAFARNERGVVGVAEINFY